VTKKPQKNGASPHASANANANAKPSSPKKEKARLAVTVDGKALADAEAREIWLAFSAHMEEHEDDTAGFAKSRGWASATPTYLKGQAVLVVKTR
jgi:hypothetical protein